MFSKSRIHEPGPREATEAEHPEMPDASGSDMDELPSQLPTAKPAASVLSSDLTIIGNLKTTGNIQVEGTVEGDISAHQLTVGEQATIRGEIAADDVVVNGRVVGRVRGLKVRLAATARVEGDIVHKTIAIEAGAHFEGSVQRQEDPLSAGGEPPSGPARYQAAARSQQTAPHPHAASQGVSAKMGI